MKTLKKKHETAGEEDGDKQLGLDVDVGVVEWVRDLIAQEKGW